MQLPRCPLYRHFVGEDTGMLAVGDFLDSLVLLGWDDANRNFQRGHFAVAALLSLVVACSHSCLCMTGFSASCIDVSVRLRATAHNFVDLPV